MQIICVCVCVRVYEEYLISILNVSQPDGTVLLGGGRGEGGGPRGGGCTRTRLAQCGRLSGRHKLDKMVDLDQQKKQ